MKAQRHQTTRMDSDPAKGPTPGSADEVPADRSAFSLTLATKVRLVILLVSIAALLAVAGAIFLVQLRLFRTTFARDLETLAAIVASTNSAALEHNDSKAAVETLSGLQAKPGIISATLVNSAGQIFARFGREETPQSLAEFRGEARSTHSGREWLHTERIVREGRSLGILHLRADYAVRRDELLHASLGIMGAVLVGSIIFILILTSRMAKVVTGPIARLAEAARDVARRNDFSVRVKKLGDDEVGQLTDAFNQMVGEMQRRDEDLALQVDALAGSEARFRGVVENLGEALLLVGLKGETLSINPRFTTLLGWTQKEIEGQNALKLLMPGTRHNSLLECHEEMTKDGNAFEVELQRRDGTQVWTEIHASPMQGANGEFVGTVAAILDITVRRQAADELAESNKRLVDASHAAGMAEVATGVLHNVGNVLNSVNLAASLSLQKLRDSKVGSLTKAAELIESKNGDLAAWLTNDPQGQKLPGYLTKLASRLTKENAELIDHLDQLSRNVEHIKQIVSVQQGFAHVSCHVETLDASQLVEEAIRMNAAKFARHGIEVVCNFEPIPSVRLDKHKTLQVLINLIRNAKHALEEFRSNDRKITIGIASGDEGFVNFTVADNGVGIAPENITRIFQHGFTTKKSGHGFGLHSGALAAKEMGGTLTVQSDGPSTGATFTLSLPVTPPCVIA